MEKQNTSRRGFTLTEIAIVLGVIGLIIGGIWVVASMVRENARISQAANQVNLISQNMSSMIQGGYGSSVAANTNITTAMISTQVIPPWAAYSATQATTPWNSTGFTMTWVTTNPHTYRMTFTNITHTGCVGLIDQITACTAGQPGCPSNIRTANGASTCDLISGACPLTTTEVQTLCNANNYTGGVDNLDFDFIN